jgi:hypothetical protein
MRRSGVRLPEAALKANYISVSGYAVAARVDRGLDLTNRAAALAARSAATSITGSNRLRRRERRDGYPGVRGDGWRTADISWCGWSLLGAIDR